MEIDAQAERTSGTARKRLPPMPALANEPPRLFQPGYQEPPDAVEVLARANARIKVCNGQHLSSTPPTRYASYDTCQSC